MKSRSSYADAPPLMPIIFPMYRNQTMIPSFQSNPFCMYSSITSAELQPFYMPPLLNVTKIPTAEEEHEIPFKPEDIKNILKLFDEHLGEQPRDQTITQPSIANLPQEERVSEDLIAAYRPSVQDFISFLRTQEIYLMNFPIVRLLPSMFELSCPYTNKTVAMSFCSICPILSRCKKYTSIRKVN